RARDELAAREQLVLGPLRLRMREAQWIETQQRGGVGRHRRTEREDRLPVVRDRARPADDVLRKFVRELDEQRALAERDDARLHGQMTAARTFTPAASSAARTAAAIADAPGVSPCRQSVTTTRARKDPSCARTPPSRTNESACFAATCGSV